jgi:pyruvate kinase
MKKTKIVCTIGPSSWDYQTLKSLAQAGMNVARLNFSHGSHEEKLQQIKYVRQISQELKTPIAIIADMQGPKIRLGEIEGTREIKKGEVIKLCLNPVSDELPMQFDLSPFVKKGQRIFLNDALVEVIVTGISGKTIETKAQNDGWVSSHKGVNIPDTHLKGQVFTQKDREDTEFALSQEVDYVAVSFIQNADDLLPVKQLLNKHKSLAKIIVKFEKAEAVNNMEEIVKQTQVIMVARGDLGIEIKASEVPIVQERLINLCRQYRKPVIVATQMLESMTENPRPTRAEVSDVARAVMDQADAVMLSAESASGKYPLEAVQVMAEVINSVEENPDFTHYIKTDWQLLGKDELSFNALASSAASLAYRIGAKTIVAATATGNSARRTSSFRPDAQIVAVTHDQKIANQLILVWGVTPIVVKPSKDVETFWHHIVSELKDKNLAQKGEKVVLMGGTTVGITGATDIIKVITV